MTKLIDLIEQRTAIVTRMREADTKGDQAAFDAAETELAPILAAEKRAKAIDDADRGEQGRPIHGDGILDKELRSRFSVVRAMAMQAGLAGHDYGFEREVQPELAKRAGRQFEGVGVPTDIFLEKRVLTTALPAGGPGGNLVATELHGEMYFDRLRAAMKVAGLGATTLSNLVGNVDIPGLKTSATSGWVAENTALTASDPEFRKVSMTPKHVGAITEVSRNMLMQTTPDIEMLVRNDLALIIADAIDRAAIAGTGAGAEPRGILNTAGIGNLPMGTNGAAMTIDTAADLIGLVATLNAPETSRGFLTTIKARVTAMKLKDGQGLPFGVPAVFKGERVEFSSNVPSNLTKGTGTNLSAAIYGNWSDLLIGYWSAFDLLVNPYESVAYAKGNVQIRAMMTADVAVRYVESFAAAKDIIA
jgi:HK97 family phage major capsid protein